jgi:hypothetical protein
MVGRTGGSPFHYHSISFELVGQIGDVVPIKRINQNSNTTFPLTTVAGAR